MRASSALSPLSAATRLAAQSVATGTHHVHPPCQLRHRPFGRYASLEDTTAGPAPDAKRGARTGVVAGTTAGALSGMALHEDCTSSPVGRDSAPASTVWRRKSPWGAGPIVFGASAG